MIEVDWPSLVAGGVVTVAVALVLRRISAKLDAAEQARAQSEAMTAAMSACVQAMARMQLVDQHDRYAAQGWMPDTARITVHALHEGYAGMGANGVIDGYMDELRALPTTPPEQTGTD